MYHSFHIPMMNAMQSKSSGLIFDDSVILRDVNLFSNYKWMQCFVLFCCNIIKSWPCYICLDCGGWWDVIDYQDGYRSWKHSQIWLWSWRICCKGLIIHLLNTLPTFSLHVWQLPQTSLVFLKPCEHFISSQWCHTGC